MEQLGKCMVCHKKAKYFMGYNVKGIKKWGYVCPQHDRYFGRINLVAAGLTMDQAVQIEREGK